MTDDKPYTPTPPTRDELWDAWWSLVDQHYGNPESAERDQREARADFEAFFQAHAAEVRRQPEAITDDWEYGVEYEVSATESVFTKAHSEKQARKWVTESPTDTGLRRRRRAGPWQEAE